MPGPWLTFHVTDRCQLDCRHCLRDPEQKPKDIDVALVRRVLGEGKRLYRSDHAAFSGGEPTLHPELEGLVDAVVDEGFTWHMVSNGRKFGEVVQRLGRRPERVRTLTCVTFSLDGATAETHDAIREEGSYGEVMTAVAAATAHGVPFALQMAVHARNEREVEAMGMLASQLGAARLSIVMTQPTGTRHDASLFLPAKDWRRLKDRIERLGHALTMPVTTPEGFPTGAPFHVCQPFVSQQLHVDVEGRLTLCCQHAEVPGGGGREVAGPVAELGLAKAHERLLGVIHDAQRQRLAELSDPARAPGAWDDFPCNGCLARFGKPHWTDDGAAGPGAERQRWTGAWESRNRLPLLRG